MDGVRFCCYIVFKEVGNFARKTFLIEKYDPSPFFFISPYASLQLSVLLEAGREAGQKKAARYPRLLSQKLERNERPLDIHSYLCSAVSGGLLSTRCGAGCWGKRMEKTRPHTHGALSQLSECARLPTSKFSFVLGKGSCRCSTGQP